VVLAVLAVVEQVLNTPVQGQLMEQLIVAVEPVETLTMPDKRTKAVMVVQELL
tara:strand:- start:143 stop:301 length:159 start_codon:yes stop_codon:yes gene_type:complete